MASQALWNIEQKMQKSVEVLNMRLGVMDATALSLCLENKLPIIVFDLQAPRSIERAVIGEPIGTIVSSEKENG